MIGYCMKYKREVISEADCLLGCKVGRWLTPAVPNCDHFDAYVDQSKLEPLKEGE
jgi:hypothetical protein